MDPSRLIRRAECEWELPQTGAMRVPGVIYADEPLIRAMDEKVSERLQRLAMTPTRMRGCASILHPTSRCAGCSRHLTAKAGSSERKSSVGRMA